jgi:hypothetical protein
MIVILIQILKAKGVLRSPDQGQESLVLQEGQYIRWDIRKYKDYE